MLRFNAWFTLYKWGKELTLQQSPRSIERFRRTQSCIWTQFFPAILSTIIWKGDIIHALHPVFPFIYQPGFIDSCAALCLSFHVSATQPRASLTCLSWNVSRRAHSSMSMRYEQMGIRQRWPIRSLFSLVHIAWMHIFISLYFSQKVKQLQQPRGRTCKRRLEMELRSTKGIARTGYHIYRVRNSLSTQINKQWHEWQLHNYYWRAKTTGRDCGYACVKCNLQIQ